MKLIISLLVALLLTNCSERPREDRVVEAEKKELQELTITTRGNISLSNTLIVVSLPDGVRCVVVDGVRSVAVDCDWRQ